MDLVYTHVREQDIPQVWGRFTAHATARFNYPGYVDQAMLDAARTFALPEDERDIDVGYRGRPLTAVMGSGALEKSIIGERFRELAGATALRVDIATSEEGRLYGEAWYRFLGRCKAVLGVESGTSYIDLEDEVHLDYAERVAEGRPVTLEALLEGPLGRWDHNFSYRTISPRHFEAAAFRICQVLFEGEYSGVLQPMVHYLPLKKDFSNFEQVVEWLGDGSLRAQITENAHRDLIRSGRYSYESFVNGVDEELIARGLSPEIAPTQRTLMDDALGGGVYGGACEPRPATSRSAFTPCSANRPPRAHTAPGGAASRQVRCVIAVTTSGFMIGRATAEGSRSRPSGPPSRRNAMPSRTFIPNSEFAIQRRARYRLKPS